MIETFKEQLREKRQSRDARALVVTQALANYQSLKTELEQLDKECRALLAAIKELS